MGGQRYIGPYAVAFALESQGIETVVVDYISLKENLLDYLRNLITKDTVAIGISSTFMTPTFTRSEWHDFNSLTIQLERYSSSPLLYRQMSRFSDWLNALRDILISKSANGKIIVGGAKTQFLLNFSSSDLKAIDYFIWGAADTVIVDVINQLSQNTEPKFLEVNGHKVIDTLNFYLAKKSCPPFKWKDNWAVQKHEALPIEISRGCIFNCKFCHYDKKESFRKDLNTLRTEILDNYERFGVTNYHFCDDCFNDGRQKVEDVCRMIMELPFKIEWISYGRFDVAVKFPHTVELMIKSGAKGIHWGVESLNAKVALNAGKGTPPDKVKKFLLDFKKNYGDQCYSHGSFIMGLPGETAESQIETIDWVVDNPSLDFITVGPLKIFPYKNSFDGQAMDFSDYSRTPEKFGFSKITFDPPNWEHSTMNRTQAIEFAEIFNRRWRESSAKRRGAINTLWNYPHIRSLGYNHNEIDELYFNIERSNFFYKDSAKRFSDRLDHYYKEILEKNGR